MLSRYVIRKVEELEERAYHRLVLVLAATSMTSVMLSGIALLFNPTFKYLSTAVLALGILASGKILRKTEKKIRKVIQSFEREAYVKQYLARVAQEYNPREYLERIYTEPAVEDPIVAKDRREVTAAVPLLKQGYTSLRTRYRIVIMATATAVAIPHVILNKDIMMLLVVVMIMLIFKKGS
ncbi:hypothetical protein Pogu_2753 [Pyrobaculum oguniense TE7]|uniref:Uncharacterized protein n=1 Tax=Pyrobaculum oguniense (strain DSM 13380 / JCM 10595 / TE7) TaxID=698757 RepID=H6QBY8_PYROT|nr:hypothetical protein Pogu_2753 [Pyrobaculum oguniense TE7]